MPKQKPKERKVCVVPEKLDGNNFAAYEIPAQCGWRDRRLLSRFVRENEAEAWVRELLAPKKVEEVETGLDE